MSKKSSNPAQGLFEQGLQAHKSSDFINAKKFYEEALTIRPNDSGVLQNIGFLHLTHRRYREAAFYLQRAYAADAQPLLLKGIGNALINIGKDAEGLDALKKYAKKFPDDAEIAPAYLRASFNLKQYEDVLSFAKKYQTNKKASDLIHVYAAEADMALGNPEVAIERLEKKLLETPDNITLLPALGKASGKARRFEEALKISKQCTEIQPNEGMHWNNYANALKNANHLDEACAAFAKARALNPKLKAVTLTNEAYIYKRQQKLDQAISLIAQSLDIEPTNVESHYAYGTLNLMAENYVEAWPHIEWRWHRDQSSIIPPNDPTKIWYGEPIKNKSLVIYTDQGIGDTLQMIRYIPMVLDQYQPHTLTLITQTKLIPLFKSCFDDPRIECLDGEAPDIHRTTKSDYQVAFCSLPNIFKTSIDTVPPCLPILTPTTPKNYKDSKIDIVIGLSWHTKSLDAGYKRSLTLNDFTFLKDLPGIRVIDLQYGDTSAQRAAAKENGFDIFHDDSVDQWNDMQSFIDQIHGCDLIISIDNTTVHAAGCCGVPVWTLLPFDPFWRWHKGPSTPWYPTMRLFRQETEGDFKTPLTHVKSEVEKLLKGDRTVLEAPTFTPSYQTPTTTKPKALLINDTYAWYHWGCTGTSQAIRTQLSDAGYDVVSVHHREIADNRLPAPNLVDFDNGTFMAHHRYLNPTLYEKIQSAEIVVINGEGTIHGMAENAIRLLYMAYIAKTHFKKPVHIINHACYPEDSMTLSDPNIVAYYLKGYRAADSIAVRDAGSHSLLTQLGLQPIQAFDSLPLVAREWIKIQKKNDQNADKKEIILAGSSKFSSRQADQFYDYFKEMDEQGYSFTCLLGAKEHQAIDDQDFIDMLENAPIDIEIKTAHSLDEWFSILNNAALLVSGRFHYSIAAACLNTPFIAFEGNTPKLAFLTKLCKQLPPLRYDQDRLCKQLLTRSKYLLENKPEKESLINDLCDLAAQNYGFLK